MHRTTMMLPQDLKTRAAKIARERSVSLGELIREALLEAVERAEARRARFVDDPLLADEAIFNGASPVDLAARHDDQLYDPDQA